MLTQYVKEKDVKVLVKVMFNITLTTKQQEIVRIIAFSEKKRICINAFTRYGKSMCVAIGVALFLWINENKKVAVIAPQEDQASIIRNYIADLIISSPRLADLVDIGRDNTIERLKKETSRKRWTFKNGCELRMISAHGEAYRLMGFGASICIIDEAALISRVAYAKIVRMLGDDPENSVLIELANPWSRDNKYYEHYTSGRFETVHIGYETGIKEGRTTETFIEEVRSELTPIEFTVLYESKFPDEAEDSLFRFSWVKRASEVDFPIGGRKIISCDPSDKGLDRTVIMWGYEQNGNYKVCEIYSEPISDNMQIASKIIEWHREKGADQINIDCIGIGAGVVSRVKEVLPEVLVKACHFGEAPFSFKQTQYTKQIDHLAPKKRFMNKKAEQYFKLRSLLEEGKVDIPNHQTLRSELMAMRWELTSSEKIRIIDPDKSPDFADACVFFIWKDMQEVILI